MVVIEGGGGDRRELEERGKVKVGELMLTQTLTPTTHRLPSALRLHGRALQRRLRGQLHLLARCGAGGSVPLLLRPRHVPRPFGVRQELHAL
jgi:hypothetical protein